MVKRKKNGTGTNEEEKRNDDGTIHQNPEPDNMENPSEALNANQQPLNQLKNRIHATRTQTKEVQSASEASETEVASTGTERVTKIIPVQRSSNRVTKRLRKETNSSDIPVKKTVVTLKQNAPLQSKTRRPWELWSVEDKNAFFEALCEYGKDFESIQSYIAQRSKKKGIAANMIKNKDQVRHFYYRTWHKISKYLQVSDDVHKHTQEIYGLVNYAELRKKIGGCLNEKNRQKLNELVFHGVTTVKYKGKKLRIKTPVCRALKKLNNVAEHKEPETEKLPKDVILELRPCNNEAWLHVQNLAQNPRIRTKVSLQRRLKSVIEHLQHRWKPYRLKKKEQIISSLSQVDASSSFHEESSLILRLKPKTDATVSVLCISAMDSASSSDVCLDKYIKISREHGTDKEATRTKRSSRPKPKSQTNSSPEIQSKDELLSAGKITDCSEANKDSIEENFNLNVLTPPTSVPESDDCSENPVDEAQRSLSLLTSMLNPIDSEVPKLDDIIECQESPQKASAEQDLGISECGTIEELYLNKCGGGESLTLGQLLGLSPDKKIATPPPEPEQLTDKQLDATCPVEDMKDMPDDAATALAIEKFKKGWTANTSGLLTVGELYLMLGQPSQIVLEYEFERCNSIEKETQSEEDIIANTVTDRLKTFAEIMRKLIQVASSTFSDLKKQTPLSPTFRNINHARVNTSSQSSSKAGSRCSSKSTTTKTTVKARTSVANIKLPQVSAVYSAGENVGSQTENYMCSKNSELCSTTNILTTVCSDGMSPSLSDKHVFVVPVGTAPRTVKKPTQESLREEIDKLIPYSRRRCRMRRKPVIVPRPLLPRDGMGTIAGPRPMAVVHLVPSGSQLTAVIPSNSSSPENNPNMLPTKKVVKIVSAGPTIDMRPIQVPLMKQVSAETNTVLQPSVVPSAISTAQIVVGSVAAQPSPDITCQKINISDDVCSRISSVHPLINMDKSTTLISSADINARNSLQNVPTLQAQTVKNISVSTSGLRDTIIVTSPPCISIPETSSSSSTNLSPGSMSYLHISLTDGLSSKTVSGSVPSVSNMLDFSENSNLSGFELPSKSSSSSDRLQGTLPSCLTSESETAPSENTPPQSPPNRPFRINSPGPEAQWLNGESVEFSLNSLLNTLESPCKVLSVSSSSVNMGSENSNLDPIARLGPVVDSQVRCLLEECSVDFIAKFEDLADVINSSNTDSKQT